jgi:hypothetical protein
LRWCLWLGVYGLVSMAWPACSGKCGLACDTCGCFCSVHLHRKRQSLDPYFCIARLHCIHPFLQNIAYVVTSVSGISAWVIQERSWGQVRIFWYWYYFLQAAALSAVAWFVVHGCVHVFMVQCALCVLHFMQWPLFATCSGFGVASWHLAGCLASRCDD